MKPEGYTVIRVDARGPRHLAAHLRRFPAEARPAVRAWAEAAEPGLYAVRLADGRPAVRRRPRSALDRTDLASAFAVSPLAARLGPVAGPVPKPAPPCLYDAVRALGPATLLTDPAGREILEAAAAAVIAFDGADLVLPPADRSRVASVAEEALSARARRAPLLRDAGDPLILVNAAGAFAPRVPGRPRAGPELLAAVRRILDAAAHAG